MTIVVTGATGLLGRLAVEALLRRGVPASDIVATGRSVEKIADLGVTVRKAPYEDVDALRDAFRGADRVLMISGSEVGKRVEQHRNVIDAAKEAGVRLLAYTSISNATTSDLILAGEHLATEQMIAESGLPHTFLRNSWYIENYNVGAAVENGLLGAAGDGTISAATRADYAEAAVAALLLDEPAEAYELGGPGFTLTELAAIISAESGKPVSYTDVTPEKYTEILVGAGVPEPFAAVLADSDRGAAAGALAVTGNDLETLLGRPATPTATAVRAALAA